MYKNRKSLFLLLLMFTFCIVMPIASADNFTDVAYVAVDGSDSGDGSFENPYSSITKAISGDKGTIILKNGTYSQYNINLNRSVKIIGQGNAVLDGNNGWIMNITNRQSSVNLVNLTFANAYSSGFGAAIINNANLTVENVSFINNSARSAPAIDNSANLYVINSLFESNDAYGRDGGAISNVANATIVNSSFISNSAARNGGAIKHQGNRFSVINSTFISNYAFGNDNYGGAIYIWASKAEIINSSFLNNTGGYGGAVFISGGNLESTQLNITNSVFELNKARSGRDIEIDDGIVNVSYSKILDGVCVLKTSAVSLDYNWWGVNAPDFREIMTSPKPSVYGVLKVFYDDGFVKCGVYWYNSSNVVGEIPRLVGSVWLNSTKLDDYDFTNEYRFKIPEDTNLSVCIDNEIQSYFLSSEIQTKLIVSDVLMYYHDASRFNVSLVGMDGNALVNQSVVIAINNVSYNRTTDENGRASIGLNLNSGSYNVSVVYNSQMAGYSSSNATATVNVLTTVNGSDVVKVFRNQTQYYATFKDFNGNYLADGSQVQFNINGVMYYRNVTSGVARLNLNLDQGNYVLTAINPVTGEMCRNTIEILPKLTENNDVVKYYRNATQYTVKLIGDDGNPVGAGENVTFNINGVFYTRQTNASGVAKLNLNLQPGEYIITAEYGECRVSNNITVLPVLSAGDLEMSYHDGSKFKAKLVDGKGNPLSGENVTFNVNGVFYSRISGSDGMASLNINLMCGEYIITSSYNEANISNKITIY